MNKLIVPVAALSPSGVQIDAAVTLGELQPKDAEPIPASMVHVRGVLAEASGAYFFQGTISGEFEHACDRCLDPVERAFVVDALWTFKQGVAAATREDEMGSDEEDDEAVVFSFDGTEIDLAPRMWEELVLAVPAKFLCRDDCAGLCPYCGANWNRGACTCRDVETLENKGLSALGDLLPQLKPKGPKE